MNEINNKIALIRPSYSVVYGLFKTEVKQESVIPPIGLLYIASVLLKNNYEVKIFDCEIDKITSEDLVLRLKEFNPLIIGVSSATPNYWMARDIIKKIKVELKTIIVLGGPHATVCAEEVLKNDSEVDFVVRGEGEFALVELADKIRAGQNDFENILGLSFRQGTAVTHSFDRPLLENLDELPEQAYSLVPYQKYTHSVPRKGVRKMAAILTSRGCPNNCTFCFRLFGRTVRYRSMEKVLEEVEYAVKNLGVGWITFYDDTFTVDKKRAIKICREIRDRGLKFDWQCFVRANTIDDELMHEFIAAGCQIVSIGVESGNDEVLRRVKKGTNVEMIRRAADIISKYDVEARGSFILGLPGETEETIKDTFKLIMELPLKRINVNICTPYPGTELFEQASRNEGIRLLSNNWQEFKRHGNCVIETDGLRSEQLIRYQKEAINMFYTRKDVLEYHLDQFLKGERDLYYYRPLIFALEHAMNQE